MKLDEAFGKDKVKVLDTKELVVSKGFMEKLDEYLKEYLKETLKILRGEKKE